VTTLEEQTLEMLRGWLRDAKRPVVMLSFGKDSMAMAWLIRAAADGCENLSGRVGFPIEVIYHRDPWFSQKHHFADRVIASWGMTVHDFPPVAAGVKVKPDRLELVARYNCAGDGIDIPKNVLEPERRRHFICGLRDWVLRPKMGEMFYPWDLVLIGHKSSDVDQFEGPVPLADYVTHCGRARVVFPLRDWTDADVWALIAREKIPVQETRYRDGVELDDKWYNNDYVHACTACIDPREKAERVYCPLAKGMVENRGAEVLQLVATPSYIAREAAA